MASVAAFPYKQQPKPRFTYRRDQRIKEAPLAAGGVRRERYDPLGRLVLEENPDGSWLRYGYSVDGDLAFVEHSSGERVDYLFDPTRGEWTARTGECETTIDIGLDGLPSRIRLRVRDCEWTVRYFRDPEGKLCES